MRILCGTVLAAVAVFVSKAEGFSRCGFMRADEPGGNPAFVASSGGLSLDWCEGSLVLSDAERNENLFVIPEGRLLLPDFAEDAALVSKTVGGDGAVRLDAELHVADVAPKTC